MASEKSRGTGLVFESRFRRLLVLVSVTGELGPPFSPLIQGLVRPAIPLSHSSQAAWEVLQQPWQWLGSCWVALAQDCHLLFKHSGLTRGGRARVGPASALLLLDHGKV